MDDNTKPRRGVIVTGAGTGIGRATARAFADQGDGVLVVGRNEATLRETGQDRPEVQVLVADITDKESPDRIVEAALTTFGRIDVVVNNAAVAHYAPIGGIDPEHALTQFSTNLFAPMLLVQRALDALAETRGTVINLGSAGALARAWPANSVYGACKVALDFFTRTWAVELAPRGIRVLGVSPGVTDTGIADRMGWGAEQLTAFLDDMLPRIPSGRLARPEEMAWWITQLARPEAAYATGAVLVVDGGASIT